jgi:CRISPR system Cascade subunit CasC
MILELHVIQNLAPANLNRDDTGAPKDAIFGGYRRARVSSQAWKRAVRNAFEQAQLLPADRLAIRTKRVMGRIQNELVTDDRSKNDAVRVAEALLQGLGLARDSKSSDEEPLTQYLLYLGNEEINALVVLASEHWDLLLAAIGGEGRKAKKDAKKAIPEKIQQATKAGLDGGRAADLALFGRMLADLPERNIDGAAPVAHAISTHAVEMEYDFFTAVDDLNQKEDTGAGMMGTVEFNSATFYRYTNVDTEQLLNNLHGDTELASATLRAYAEAFLTSMPTGKQNSFAAQNPPSCAVAIIRDAGRWSLTNAFVEPIRKGRGDLVGESIRELGAYWQRLSAQYGSEDIVARPILVDAKYESNVAGAFDAPAAGLGVWLDQIDGALVQKKG